MQNTPFSYQRRETVVVYIGELPLGGGHPLRVQSMANVSSLETEQAIEQAERVALRGCDYFRFTAQGVREAQNLDCIRQGLRSRGVHMPLIADIHFNSKAALAALDSVEKVRINPGNFAEVKKINSTITEEIKLESQERIREKFGAFLDKAAALGRAIRIGVNHGSLSERIVSQFGDSPRGMVESCLEYLDICGEKGFHNVVISMKSSNVLVMTQAVRLLVETLKERGYPSYPLHLGVTEAGEGEDGRIKSAIGIGSLLVDGIGDTLRVSLSEEPEEEIPVARELVDYISRRAALPKVLEYTEEEAQSYRAFAQADREQSESLLRGSIGGSATPIVLGNAEHALGKLDDLLPDYLIDDEGRVVYPRSQGVLPVESIILDATSIAVNQDSFFWDSLKERASGRLIILRADGDDPISAWRLAFTRLRSRAIWSPIVLARRYSSLSLEELRLIASVEFGSLLLDGVGSGVFIEAPDLTTSSLVSLSLGILQATRLRISHTEFISCPGCGRTLFDLQKTVAAVKQSLGHLKGLKIGVMGCIVNGPGEMADADYGYVGSTPGMIDLYKGRTCISKGINEKDAVAALVQLIKDHGDWVES